MENISWMDSLFFSRHLVPRNVGNIIFVCYFLNIAFVIFSMLSQIPNGTSLRKSIPGLPRLEPHRKVNATTLYNFLKLLKLCEKRPTCFQTLTFCRNLSFQKPWICPWIFQRFSMDFPPHGFSGNPWESMGIDDWTPRPNLQAA